MKRLKLSLLVIFIGLVTTGTVWRGLITIEKVQKAVKLSENEYIELYFPKTMSLPKQLIGDHETVISFALLSHNQEKKVIAYEIVQKSKQEENLLFKNSVDVEPEQETTYEVHVPIMKICEHCQIMIRLPKEGTFIHFWTKII